MQAVTECLASFSPTTCAFLTLDLQNHGDRCLNPLANLDFKAGNPHHAWDMYAIQLQLSTVKPLDPSVCQRYYCFQVISSQK
ncbi:hypothetical protein HMI56_002602 [Coelomomyces lativittatus]|nr:hypothetical protein HMI56_002602 [Coelomomyces lativittatus]